MGLNFAKSDQSSETDIISNYVHITVFTPMWPKKRIRKRKIHSVPLPFPQDKINFLDVSQKVPQKSTISCNVCCGVEAWSNKESSSNTYALVCLKMVWELYYKKHTMGNPCYTLIVWNLRNIIRYLSWLTRRNQEFELKAVYRGYKLTKRPHHWAKNPNEWSKVELSTQCSQRINYVR